MSDNYMFCSTPARAASDSLLIAVPVRPAFRPAMAWRTSSASSGLMASGWSRAIRRICWDPARSGWPLTVGPGGSAVETDRLAGQSSGDDARPPPYGVGPHRQACLRKAGQELSDGDLRLQAGQRRADA